MKLVSELRRRSVFRMAVLYVVSAWLIMQVTEVLMGLAPIPDWIGKAVLAILSIGFPIALILSWFYELTPGGISLERDVEATQSFTHVTGRRVDFVIIALLCAAVLLFAYDKWWISPPPKRSIAVLAFQNMSGDPDQEYFSDGISEEILNLLAQLPELTVISRSSAFSFKGKDVPIPAIAEQLNVAHVLEGSVRRVGDRVRITAQLIEARSDAQLWSQTYDREVNDIFAIQDEIAAAISDTLKVKLTAVANEKVVPAAIKPTNAEAYNVYLQGRELIHSRVKDDLQEAIRHLERSVSLDNRFAPAHAQLAIATLLYHGYSHEEGRRTAKRHLDRAQVLEPDLAEAHAGRALLALKDDPESAIRHAENALAANPNYIDAMNWLSYGLRRVGRFDEANAIFERMLVTDPLSIVTRMRYAHGLLGRGRYAEAHALADRVIEQSPSAGYGLHAEIAYLGEGDLTQTVYWGLKSSLVNAWARDALTLVGEFDEARRLARNEHWIDLTEGRWDEAIQKSKDILLRYPDSLDVTADTANVLFLAHRFDEALALYERALRLSPGGMSIRSPWGNYYMMHLALARRRAGDDEGAEAAASSVRQYVARRAPEEIPWMEDVYAAMIAAFDHDADGSIAALATGIRHGLRAPWVFIDPAFDDLRDDPRFADLRQELNEILAWEHQKILQLICFNNPVPDDWQPLPETCEGEVEGQGH
jgi:TolB-like protein/Tfp pilus assembly protein PilF